jgi:DNA-binding transcriptional ArsR family regulator
MPATTRYRRSGDELIDPRLARAISHPLRVQIMVELYRAPMSPAEYATKFGGSLENVAYHFRVLMGCDCVEVVAKRKSRGATEHFYGSTRRALFSAEEFSQLPMAVRGGISAATLSAFMDQAAEALLTNKLDSHANRHLTWQRRRLDEEGFTRVMERLDSVFEWVPVEEAAAVERMKKSGEDPLITTIGLFGFECPEPDRGHDLTA